MRLSVKQTALFISLCFCAITAFTLNNYGVTWDEGVYFYAGDSYFKWLINPSLATIDAQWKINHEHPPLVKLCIGFTHYLFKEKLNLLNHVPAYRFSILFFVFIANYFLFRFATELLNQKVAILTTATFFFLPRIFFHSHLGAMDYPVTALWLAVIYFFWKGTKETRNIKSIMLCAVFLGLALLTKINAVSIYIPLLFFWTWGNRGGENNPHVMRSFIRLIPIFIVPPIMFIVFWPWLWQETIPRIHNFLSFHMHHPEVYTYYFGKQTPLMPWHYPFVMTIITLPMLVLFLFSIGLIRIMFHPDKTNIFILFNALFPLLLVAMPTVPKYDGVRLFLPAFPFICMIAGIGLHHLFMFKKGKWGNFFFLIYTLIFLVTIHTSIIKPHPYQSSYFNELIGGVDGAAKKGFEAEYWGNAYIGVLPWMNDHLQNTFWVYMADLESKVLWGFDLYKENGMLDQAVKFGNKKNSDYLILLIRQGFFNEEMWGYFRYEKPVFSVRLSKTNLVNIYRIK